MNASLRELNVKASELARRAEAGETITITDRGRPIADLGPHRTGARFVDRDQVLHAFAVAPSMEYERLRAELDEIADPGFADPFER